MRNRYGGRCYRCGLWVDKGQGHFERVPAGWRVQHATCAIAARGYAPKTTKACGMATDENGRCVACLKKHL